jgi:hypothetical protein
VLVRRDLPAPQQAVQAIHAALEAGRAGLIASNAEHPHVVLCHVESIHALLRASDQLKQAEILHQLFHEPDLDGAPTALATEPVRGKVRAHFRRFQLLRSEVCR